MIFWTKYNFWNLRTEIVYWLKSNMQFPKYCNALNNAQTKPERQQVNNQKKEEQLF